MSVLDKRCMFLVSDRHSRHVYNRQLCFEQIYVAKGENETLYKCLKLLPTAYLWNMGLSIMDIYMSRYVLSNI